MIVAGTMFLSPLDASVKIEHEESFNAIKISDVPSNKEIDVKNLIKVLVTSDTINLRREPSSKGKILDPDDVLDVIDEFCSEKAIIVYSVPVQNKSENTEWYKIILKFDNFIVDIKQVLYDVYISTESVKQVPLNEWEEGNLNWFARGRPPFFNTGDLLYKSLEDWEAVPIKEKMNLYLEPKETAKVQEFPKGTKILVYRDLGAIDGVGAFDSATCYGAQYYYHIDMEDIEWNPVVGEDGRIMGWFKERNWDEAKIII
jgi:hypothetical protein